MQDHDFRINNRIEANLKGTIVDGATGQLIPARVQVLTSKGRFVHPAGSLLKEGSGDPFFYSEGTFEVDVSRGNTRVIVERGTEYTPAKVDLYAPAFGTVVADIVLERWTDLGDRGWHPGNTHIHYDDRETRPDERLRLDPRVEDLRMTAISILKQGDMPYASNKYSPGMLTDFSSAHHYVQCGEESRHNFRAPGPYGYGHVMLLNIKNIVEPITRGRMVDAFDPDYPPLSYVCDDTRRQGGIVIWCHNGLGIEAPVAGVLGKLDAFNLFDDYWMDPEYDVYYQMLNAGIRMPVSTGSDWYVCNGNRVYAYTGKAFEYESWLDALKKGRTFISNGPVLELNVQGNIPGAEIEAQVGDKVSAMATWESHYPVSHVEILFNGKSVATEFFPDGLKNGQIEVDVPTSSDGWIAARISTDVRDSYHHPVFAHTSPVYINTGLDSPEMSIAARGFSETIERNLEWVMSRGKFYTDHQRREVSDLHKAGQELFNNMIKA